MNEKRVQELKVSISVIVTVAFFVYLYLTFPLTNDEYSEMTRIEFFDIATRMTAIRGIDVPPELDVTIVDQAYVRETWSGYTEEDLEDIKRTERIYKSLFLLDRTDNLSAIYVDQAAHFLAFYQPSEVKVYVVREWFDPSSPGGREALAHEITHALTFTHFTIPQASTFDEDRAISALIEGDANLAARQFMSLNDNRSPAIYISSPDAYPTAVPQSVPEAIDQLFSFQYVYGDIFLEAVHDSGGWEAVNNAYTDTPRTSEEVMHPEKFLGDRDRLELDIKPQEFDGWEISKQERFGEFFIRVMLARHLPEEAAITASEGWGNDSFLFYERGDDFAFIWKIFFDSPEDSKEFFLAFQEMMNSVEETDVLVEGCCRVSWDAEAEDLKIKKRGASGVIITASTDEALFNRLS